MAEHLDHHPSHGDAMMTSDRTFSAAIPDHSVTPAEAFFNRRRFIGACAAAATIGPIACAKAGGSASGQDDEAMLTPPFERPDVFPAARNDEYEIPEAITRRKLTPRAVAANHNNFYEFLPGRGGPVWKNASDFTVTPWSIEITGECNNPMTVTLDDLFKIKHEERIYHFRCVERWAMNIPWTGFPLHKMLKQAKPTDEAKFVRFESALKREEMPGVRESPSYPWPYFEGLRIDEAMHDLAFIVTGAYGKVLLKQHGAPARLAVPWKYGYKGPKSIVKIEFVRDQPQTFWRKLQPHEYGFLSNVNPNIPHPRWSQARSQWLENRKEFNTPIFNGYEKYVADLYPDEPRTLQQPLRPGQIGR